MTDGTGKMSSTNFFSHGRNQTAHFRTASAGACYGFKIGASPQLETVMHTEIVQSWDQVQAVAAVSHTQVTPGTTVTFSHKDSHILNAQVHMASFDWTVTNKDTDDILWQDSTTLLNQALTYTFEDVLDWDDTQVYTVTLTVTDADGQEYVDETYEITVALDNHAPTVVTHPTGDVYTAYPGSIIQIDARGSFDTDAAPFNDRVFEADATRPNGIADSVTSICVDLDRDGTWCEDGEDGLNQTVALTIADDYEHGNAIAIPIRVCDDGRWNGKCYEAGDGAPAEVTQEDCSRCAYADAIIEIKRCDIDEDADGYLSPSCGGLDCDDSNVNINPGADDAPGDGLDTNCDNFDGTAVCGNGALEGDEDCDDGNTIDGDDCDRLCRTEICDDCNVCDAFPENDNETCVQDCAGIWGGTAFLDDCGV